MSNNLAEMPTSKVIDLAAERFEKLAPKSIRFEAEKGYALQLLQNNPFLAQVAEGNKLSLLHAVTNCAAIGLSLNPAKREAYLITRTVKEGNQYISKVFLEPSYQGLCNLATNTGSIEWVQANVVYANDVFIDNGVGEKPTHTYSAFAKPDSRGEFAGVYCVAKTKSGDFLTTIMPADEVYSVRDRSEAYKAMVERKKGNGGPWVSDFNEMAKKSVVRRAVKMWPKTDQFERMDTAVSLSNENEGFVPIVTAPNLGEFTADQKAYFDQCITSADDVGMFLFTKSIDESTFTNLYHSFEKGQKGKYQGVVDNLCQQGAAKLRDVSDAIAECCQRGDDPGALELLDGFTSDAIDYMAEHFMDQETGAYSRQLLAEQ
jgi:recombination protein RecT